MDVTVEVVNGVSTDVTVFFAKLVFLIVEIVFVTIAEVAMVVSKVTAVISE